MIHILYTLFSWPNGIVVGNLLASLIWVGLAAIGIYFFRDRIGKRLTAFWHRHHAAHVKEHADEDRLSLPLDRVDRDLPGA